MSNVPSQIFTIVSGRGVIRLTQFVTFVLLARSLSPDEFGWFGILTTAFVLASTIGSLGFRQSFAYEVGQGRMSPAEANGTTLLLWPLFTLVAAAVVSLIYASRVPTLSVAHACAVITAGVAGTMFLTLIQGTFLGRGEIGSFTLSESLPRVVLLVLIGILALTGGITLGTSLWSNAASFAVMVPVAIWLATRGAGRPRLQFRRLRWMVGYGLVFALNLFLITLGSRLAIFLLERFGEAADAGRFFAAVRVNEIFLEVATAVGMVLFSHAARQEPSESVVARNARIACWMFWLFLGLAVGVAAAAPVVVSLVLGSGYAQAAPALQILAIGLAPAAANKVIYPTLAGLGKPYFGTPVILIGLTANFTLALLLIPVWGVQGGATAVVLGQFLIFGGYIVLLRRQFNVPPRLLVIPSRKDAGQVGHLIRTRVLRRNG